MDRFDAMRLFTRIVERRSFTQAAQDLGLPRSSATDAMKELEGRLGVQLLQRTTRHVSPTPDGEAYYATCLRLIADLEEAEGAFRGVRPRGPLHVDVHATLAGRFVVPHLPEFLATYPEIHLLISEGDRYVDLIREGVDCVLRVGHLPDSELMVRRLAMLEEVTCASSAYLARRGTPMCLEDLQAQGHCMVGFLSSSVGAVLPLDFVSDGQVRQVTLPTSLVVTGAETYVAAARAGMGLVQAPRYRFEEDFRQGRLVPVLPNMTPTPSPVSVLYPRAKHLSSRVRVFIDWLAGRFRQEVASG